MTVAAVEHGGAVAAVPDAAARLVQWGQAASAAHALAQSLCRTRFVPEAFRGEDKVGDATAAILLGAELGLSPIAAMRALYVAKSGEPTLYSRALVGLVQAHGHEVWTESEAPGRVTVAGRRAGSEHTERVTWDLERAKAAGLAGRNPVYRDHPQAMLYARAAADVARRIAPDVLLGIPEGIADEAAPTTPVEATVTVQRRGPGQGPTGGTPVTLAPAAPTAAVAGPAPDQAPTVPADVRQDTPPVDLGDAPEAPPVEPREPRMTSAQRAMLHAQFKAAGMSRDEYMAWSERHTGRPLSSTNDLTVAEASHLLDRIAAVKAARAGQSEPAGDGP